MNFELTNKELDILKLVAQGSTSREIGQSLGISEKTAKNHMVLVKAKLRAKNSPHAVAIAKDRGLI